MLHYLLCLLQLLLSPGNGWEDISHAGTDERRLLLKGYLPLCGIVGASVLVKLVYNPELQFVPTLLSALICFATFFVSYYIAWFIMPLFLPDDIEGELNIKRTSTFILYVQGLLAITALLGNLTPIEVSLIQFMPVYVGFILWKGYRYMAVKDGRYWQFIVLGALAVMAPPYLLSWAFNLLF